jgi:putative tryptophan/tyrosine transport system substrate-binding protein
MRRREFIAGLGGAAAAAWPLVARAQQRAMPVVGWLDNTAASTTNRITAFRQGLSAAGFVEGSNVSIEFRWAENRLDRLPALAADLVRKQVSAIVTNNTSTPAAKAATPTIPIVFVTGGDPVETGLVTSLNRPGGNVTGVSFTGAPLNPRRLELLHEMVPKSAVIAALMDANFAAAALPELEAAASKLGRQIVIVKAGTESEIDAAFAMIVESGARLARCSSALVRFTTAGADK